MIINLLLDQPVMTSWVVTRIPSYKMTAGSLPIQTLLGAFLEKAKCLLARYSSKRCLLPSVDQRIGKHYDVLVNKIQKHKLNPGEFGAIVSI